MKPLVICTPRTGSTLFTRKLFKIAKTNWGHKSLLGEYFNISPVYQMITKTIDGVMYYDRIVRDGIITEEYKQREISSRINLLNQQEIGTYLYKVHSGHITADIYDFILEKKYDVIYLHRRNKLDQLLSFMAAISSKKWIHTTSDYKQIHEIIYRPENTKMLFDHLDRFYEVRRNLVGIDIYYEDFMAEGGNERAIIKIMNMSDNLKFESTENSSIPTSYANVNRESLIVNSVEWSRDKHNILTKLKNYD